MQFKCFVCVADLIFISCEQVQTGVLRTVKMAAVATCVSLLHKSINTLLSTPACVPTARSSLPTAYAAFQVGPSSTYPTPGCLWWDAVLKNDHWPNHKLCFIVLFGVWSRKNVRITFLFNTI